LRKSGRHEVTPHTVLHEGPLDVGDRAKMKAALLTAEKKL
jgi:hypothetical protein